MIVKSDSFLAHKNVKKADCPPSLISCPLRTGRKEVCFGNVTLHSEKKKSAFASFCFCSILFVLCSVIISV